MPELLRRLHEIAKSEITGEFINLRSEFPEDAGELWAIHSILTAAHHYDTGDLQWDDDQSLHTFSIEVYFPMPTYRKGRKADNE